LGLPTIQDSATVWCQSDY